MILSHLQPEKIFSIFESICAIPHGSGNTEAISRYCADYATQRGLKCIRDHMGNVIIFIPPTPGYEDAETVILQGHMDMVCVKTPDCPLDLTRDGLELATEGDAIFAKGTSLGADNGIALAMMLALADSSDLPHPPLELLITVDEETGLYGAAGVDFTPLKGKKLINMDSEEEGVFTVSCAGGLRATLNLPVTREASSGPVYRLTLGGLTGGHSGVEIHTGRANANNLMGQILKRLEQAAPVSLMSLHGGMAGNAISSSCQALLRCEDPAPLAQLLPGLEAELKAAYAQTDPDLFLTLEETGEEGSTLIRAHTETLISMLTALPQGVQTMSPHIPGLVQTSLNLGVSDLEEEALLLEMSVRSSVEEEKAALMETLAGICRAHGATMVTDGEYPGWAYEEISPLRDLMVEVFTDLYGHPPRIEAIHAGLECGLLRAKRPELDCISLGPDLKSVHSPDEQLSISSTQRVWKFLLEVLKRSK